MKRAFMVLSVAVSAIALALHGYNYLNPLATWLVVVLIALVAPLYLFIAYQRSMLYGFGAILIRKVDTSNPTPQMALHRRYSAFAKVGMFLYLMCLYIFRAGAMEESGEVNWQILGTGLLFTLGISAVLFFVAEWQVEKARQNGESTEAEAPAQGQAGSES